jgi:hypothetical protein
MESLSDSFDFESELQRELAALSSGSASSAYLTYELGSEVPAPAAGMSPGDPCKNSLSLKQC